MSSDVLERINFLPSRGHLQCQNSTASSEDHKKTVLGNSNRLDLGVYAISRFLGSRGGRFYDKLVACSL